MKDWGRSRICVHLKKDWEKHENYFILPMEKKIFLSSPQSNQAADLQLTHTDTNL